MLKATNSHPPHTTTPVKPHEDNSSKRHITTTRAQTQLYTFHIGHSYSPTGQKSPTLMRERFFTGPLACEEKALCLGMKGIVLKRCPAHLHLCS